MSGKTETKSVSAARGAAPTDRRIVRTRDTLGDALLQLMEEQSFDSITVQQVLDRAGVSRSTFYAHYRDKDDLFLSDVEEFLELIGMLLTRRGASVRRLFPVEEFFSHIAESPGISEAINASGKGPDVTELGIGCFARSIEQRLILARVPMTAAELHATAHSLAGSLFSLLRWWLRDNKALAPKDLDAHFHRLAWGGIGAVSPRGR
jgi:AcrR family transcriptional regulator